VSKLSKTIAAIGQVIRNPWLLNKVLDDDHYWKKQVARWPGTENGFPVIMPWDLFGDFNESVSPFAFLDGGSLPTDLALLKKLARNTKNCSYFEIGTWRGESVANVAAVARECFTLNLSAEEMKGMGKTDEYIRQHGIYSRQLPNVTHLEGNTRSFDFAALNRKFDLVFIDGDHHYKMVKNDTEKVFRHLVHDKTVVVWHDYARNPENVRYEVMAGILAGCPEHLHDKLFHLAHTLCAVYLPGPFRHLIGTESPGLSGYFSLDINCHHNFITH
jgi:predicted O-methyltransferase YrrM